MAQDGRDKADLALAAVAGRARELAAAGRVELGELDARELLGPLLGFGQALACETAAQAAQAASRLGGETIVKAIVPGVLHKSDRGLVSRPCADPAEAQRAAADLLARVAAEGLHTPTLSVQARLAGVEIAAGLRQTELGPVCLIAAGGVLVELVDDSAVAMAPLDRARAHEAVESLRVAPLLSGYRGGAPADLDALVELIVRLGRLAVAAPEIRELDLNPIFAAPSGALAADARCVLAPADPAAAELDPAAKRDAMRALFAPRRIAVIGASEDSRKVGGLLLRYLRSRSWEGEIVAVNPKGVEVEGVSCARTVSELDPPPDLACIAVPAAATEAVVGECVEAGVRSGVVYASGFAETGEQGRARQDRLLAASRDSFHFVGPNSIGFASLDDRLIASFAMGFETAELPVGPIAFASQSGAIASSLLSRAAEWGVGFSHWISTGNEADLGLAECVDYFAEAPGAEVICLFVEAIRRPREFRSACERARAAGRPVVALLAGRSEPGREATASHTGALTGAASVYEAFFRECGVIGVATLPELFVAAKALGSIGPVTGSRLGIISMSGGACSLLADQATEQGLEVPRLPDAAQDELRAILPAFAAVRNPVDVTAVGIGSPDLVHRTLTVLRRSGAVDLVIVQLSTNADPAAEAIAADLVAARDEPGAPFLVGRLGSPAIAPAAVARYRAAQMPVFGFPDELARAARACVVAN